MRPNLLAGPLLVLLWQAAPIQSVRDSTGRTHVTFGFGAGQFEDRVYACDGQLVSAVPARYQTGGATLEYWPATNVRLNAFGGGIASANKRFAGGFGGLGAAFEGGIVGIGGGLAFAPIDSQATVAPSVYLRIGGLNRPHLRADLFNPEAAFGTTGILRMGLAGNQGLLRGPRWFVGFSVPLDARGQKTQGVFGELSVPVSSRLDLMAGVGLRSGAQNKDWGISGGIRYGFGGN